MLRLWWLLESWTYNQAKVGMIFILLIWVLYSRLVSFFKSAFFLDHSNFSPDLICIVHGIWKGTEKMQRAFEIYPYCAMALNYLANHFFFTGQHFLVEQLTETALAVSNHKLMKAHSYYNLARSYHSKVPQDIYYLRQFQICIS